MIHEYEQEGIVTSGDFRASVAALISFDLHALVDGYLGSYWGISRCLTLSIFFWGLMSILWRQIPNLPLFTVEWLLGTAPVWLPVITLIVTWEVWLWHSRSSYLFYREPLLLEVKMPREITR